MNASSGIRIGVNGFGVIDKRVAEEIALQDDMNIAGVSDVGADRRMRVVTRKGFHRLGATPEQVNVE